MRIAITGVAGTGKTTLGRLISSKTSLEYIHDVNDTVLNRMGYENGGALFNARGQEGMIMIDWHMKAIAAKIESDRTRDNYVNEKGVFDFGARWFARMYPEAKESHYETILSAMNQGTNLYDKIIFLPLNLERGVEDNGMRTTDPMQRRRFDWL